MASTRQRLLALTLALTAVAGAQGLPRRAPAGSVVPVAATSSYFTGTAQSAYFGAPHLQDYGAANAQAYPPGPYGFNQHQSAAPQQRQPAAALPPYQSVTPPPHRSTTSPPSEIRSFNNAALRLVPSSPAMDREVESSIVADAAARNRHVVLPAPAVETQLRSMIAEIRAAAPHAIPEAKYMAAETRFYVVQDDKSINMTSVTRIERDRNGAHAVNAIVITQGALDNLGKLPFKEALAHEFAHHLFAMNPALLTNPRYAPKSQAYQEEIARTNFTPTTQEINNYSAQYAALHAQAPTRDQVLGYIRETTHKRANMYKEEAMADKVGLRLTKNVYAAQTEQAILARGHLGGPGTQAAGNATIDKRGQTDPHPSAGVRLEENLQTMKDMQNEGLLPATRLGHAKPVPPSGARPQPQ